MHLPSIQTYDNYIYQNVTLAINTAGSFDNYIYQNDNYIIIYRFRIICECGLFRKKT